MVESGAGEQLHPVRHRPVESDETADAQVADAVAAHSGHALARGRPVQADVADLVEACREAGDDRRIAAEQRDASPVVEVGAVVATVVELLELVAIDRVVEKVGEVRKQLQAIVDRVEPAAHLRIAIARPERKRQHVAVRVAAAGRIDETVAVDPTVGDRTFGNLIAAGPAVVVGAEGQADPAVRRFAQPAQQPARGALVHRQLPGAVVDAVVDAGDQGAGGSAQAAGNQAAAFAVLADAALDQIRRVVHPAQLGAAGGGEVAVAQAVAALAVVVAGQQLGNQEVEVQVALAVTVRGQVERHALDRDGEVGAVIQVEAPREVLVGLALAAVLRGDEAGNQLEQVAGALARVGIELAPVDAAGRGRRRHAGIGIGIDVDVVEFDRCFRHVGRCGRK